jgi:predicted nucleic acid-binding protein
VTRVVIDTNVFVSALIGKKRSAADQVVRAFTDDRLEVVVSPTLLSELSACSHARSSAGTSARLLDGNTSSASDGTRRWQRIQTRCRR